LGVGGMIDRVDIDGGPADLAVVNLYLYVARFPAPVAIVGAEAVWKDGINGYLVYVGTDSPPYRARRQGQRDAYGILVHLRGDKRRGRIAGCSLERLYLVVRKRGYRGLAYSDVAPRHTSVSGDEQHP